jgi:hypothetical protein
MLGPRASEWISILAFAGLVMLSWQRGLDMVRQVKIAAIGGGAIVIIVIASLALPRLVSPTASSATRDLMPCLLLLLFYSQAGQFVTRVDGEVEMRFARLDKKWIAPWLKWSAARRLGTYFLASLEVAYLSYYVSVPLAIGALYWFGKQGRAGHFWTVVLLAAYGSCGMLPFIQTRPPRMLGEEWSACLSRSKVRAFNLWILRHGSVRANTIPSAHVAIATACALALMEIGPTWIGIAFLVVAVGIALGAVAGRYHYGTDAVLGFVLAAMSSLAGAGLSAWLGVG